MNNIYLVSGLGADERVFNCPSFPEKCNVIHIKWITPFKKESLSDYARRLSDQIQTENNIIIGLSFGGIIALELSKYKQFEKIILISSVKSTKELPLYYRIIGKLKLIKIIPSSLFTIYTPLLSFFFGVKTSQERDLLRIIIKDTDPYFAKWAINSLLTWDYSEENDNIIHIHGTTDRLIPYRYISNPVSILNGTHFMIVSEAEKISSIIQHEIMRSPA